MIGQVSVDVRKILENPHRRQVKVGLAPCERRLGPKVRTSTGLNFVSPKKTTPLKLKTLLDFLELLTIVLLITSPLSGIHFIIALGPSLSSLAYSRLRALAHITQPYYSIDFGLSCIAEAPSFVIDFDSPLASSDDP